MVQRILHTIHRGEHSVHEGDKMASAAISLLAARTPYTADGKPLDQTCNRVERVCKGCMN